MSRDQPVGIFAPKRRIASWIAVVVCAHFCLQPHLACGHGADFLFAKVTIGDGHVHLEITADCESNALIPDRSFAAAALPTALEVQIGADTKSLLELSKVELEDRSQFDETVPLPPGTLDNSISHQLLTALWRWKPDIDFIRFAVPKSSKLDVLLWVTDTRKPDVESRWMVLLGGDLSPPIWLESLTTSAAALPEGRVVANSVGITVITFLGIMTCYGRIRRRANQA